MATRCWTKINPPLSHTTLSAISKMGFTQMAPVQAATIPQFLQNKDVAVEACTGSGKTLAFLVPIVEILLRRDDPLKPQQIGAIVISPTRELAQQIYLVAKTLTANLDQIALLLLTGGVAHEQDTQTFEEQGGNIVIGTPGRLAQNLKTLSKSHTKELEVLVLDEADRLLEMGFSTQITDILSQIPKLRRTGLFSATLSNEVERLVRAGLRNPVRIEVKVEFKNKTQQTPESLQNTYVILNADRKLGYLIQFLQTHRKEKIIVFMLTCSCVDYFGKVLSSLKCLRKSTIFKLHGRMKQKQRNRIYSQYQSSSEGVLLCTDLVARGIDIPDVHWILQYDPPQDPNFFVHRVGRTARMGRKGRAIVLLIPEERLYSKLLETMNVPISEQKKVGNFESESILKQVKEMQIEDRDVLEKAQKAFVSYIRGYKEHHSTYVFSLSRLDITGTARGFGLLYVPKMPEIKGKTDDFVNFPGLDSSKITFKDKHREKQRLASVKDKRKKKQEEKEKRLQKKKERDKAQKLAAKQRRKRKNSETQDKRAEWNELAEEMRLYKRVKKGKMSQEDFEVAVGERRAPEKNSKMSDVE